MLRVALFFVSPKDVGLVLGILAIIIALPIIAVLALTQVGIGAVSSVLAKVDPITSNVSLFYPNGGLYRQWDGQVIWPTKGVITLEFGVPEPPFALAHTGIDIASQNGLDGEPVYAFSKGTVVFAGEINWGYGKYVEIDHGDNLHSIYGHLSEIDVQKGQQVEMGQQVGQMGHTGWATGPHLHFQTNLWGIPINPRSFLGNGTPYD
jgi:murein DD-endopeptidase MepM/ murein hydrolase activator NlpD